MEYVDEYIKGEKKDLYYLKYETIYRDYDGFKNVYSEIQSIFLIIFSIF